MKVYIDTNIYAAYINSSSDIKILRKLKRLILSKKIEVVLPLQTKEEFTKHYPSRVGQVKKKLKTAVTQFELPDEIKGKNKESYSRDEREIAEKVASLNLKLKKLVEKSESKFKIHLQSVDILIKEIFKLSTNLEDSEEVVLKAIVRFAKGLPPKKENLKFGDAIIWETLKRYIKTESLVIVSLDNDYGEVVKERGAMKIKKLLKVEWKKHTKKNLSLFTSLGSFVNHVEPNNPISSESIKKEEVQAVTYNENQSFLKYFRGIDTRDLTGAFNSSSILADITKERTNWYNPFPTLDSSIALNDKGTIVSNNSNPEDLWYKFSTCARCSKIFESGISKFNGQNLCGDCSKHRAT